MKVEIDSASLSDAVSWTTRVIDLRPANPVLAGILVQADTGILQLSAFNYEVSARHHIEAGIDEPGTALVPGKLLADITKSLPTEKTYLSTTDSSMTITSGKSTFTLQLMPESEYPDLPAIPGRLGQVDAQTFMQAVNQAAVAVSREENRPVLTAVRIQFNGEQVVMTATDRFRLSRSSFTWTPDDHSVEVTALVRGALLKDTARGLDDQQNVIISADVTKPTTVGVENAGRTTTMQLIDGEFPAIDRLFADAYPIQAVVATQPLIDATKRVSLVAERNAPIRLSLAGHELSLSAGAEDESRASEILEADLDGEEISLAFNPTYLVEGLSAITEPFVRMKITSALKPVEFNGQQEADSDESLDYRYLLVPMRFTS